MPVLQVLDAGEVLPLEGLGDDGGGAAADGGCLVEGLHQLRHVVPVHHQRVQAERLHAGVVHVQLGRGCCCVGGLYTVNTLKLYIQFILYVHTFGGLLEANNEN